MKFNNTNISIGKNVKIGDNTTIYDNVTIGDNKSSVMIVFLENL